MHRRQKEDFAEFLRGKTGSEEYEALNRKTVMHRMVLLEGNYGRCLEIGCENGWFGRKLVDEGRAGRSIGVDLRVEEMAGKARPLSALVAGSAERLPLRNVRFDLIVAFHVIEHLRDPDAFRRELRRLAAPSAHFILAVPMGWDEDPCHRWHFMSPLGWKRFLRKRYGLEFLKGSVHAAAETEFLGLFRLQA